MNRIKTLLALLLGALMALVMQRQFIVKTDAMDDLYSGIVFTRLAVESQQYTRQIEYGLKNGKELDKFYNIQNILSEVKRCSSYTNGAYIVSADNKLLYSLSEQDEDSITTMSVSHNFSDGEVYSVYNESARERYILTIPIYGKSDVLCGYLLLNISHAAIDNVVDVYRQEYLIQTYVIGIELYLFGAVLLINFVKRPQRVYFDSSRIIVSVCCLSALLDGAISVIMLKIRFEEIIQQSVSKITMTLQNDLDTVQSKGASLSQIFDLNSWLLENCGDIPFIDNLIYDKNYKITAIISDSYITNQTLSFALTIAIVLGVSALIGFALIMLSVIADKYNSKKMINRGEAKKDDNQRRLAAHA
ncbi:MAG: hypothetical protein ACI4KM_07155 [Oscillospiraceae bacterium]